MLLVVGVLAALWERRAVGSRAGGRRRDGRRRRAAGADGVGLLGQGAWRDERGVNLLDGGAPFYDTYACADGGTSPSAPLEPQFYAALLDGLGLDQADLPAQYDQDGWPTLRARFTEVFATRSRDEWAKLFDGTDACVSPVLTFAEAAEHPHLEARSTIVAPDGVRQAAPAPRFSRTAPGLRPLPGAPEDVDAVLADWS